MLLIIIDQLFCLFYPFLPYLLQISVHIATPLQLVEQQVDLLLFLKYDTDQLLKLTRE